MDKFNTVMYFGFLLQKESEARLHQIKTGEKPDAEGSTETKEPTSVKRSAEDTSDAVSKF